MLALFASPVVGPLRSFQEIETKKAPTPADLHLVQHTVTWGIEALLVAAVGAAMFILSLLKIRRIDAADRSREERWSG